MNTADSSHPAGGTGQVRLRPYQERAVTELRELIGMGARRIIIVAATGSGKTTVAGHLIGRAASKGRRSLFIAHRRELINQAYDRMVQMGLPETDVGIIMARDPRRRPGARVQIASINTLRNRPKPRADVVFIDESHRALAKSYRDLATHYPDAIHIGLTATPYRADGRGLGDMYDELVQVSSPRELIREGYLVEPRVFTVPPNALPDLSSVRVRRGDYHEAELAEAVDKQSLVGNIVEHWHRHAQGLRTVAFAVSVKHSMHIAEQFRQAGVPAEHLDGTTPLDVRDGILARLDSGETLVASNVGVLQEGWDQPSVKCAILARPTKSTGLYLQQAGRILRPWGGLQAIILDHAGCALSHGLPQDDREFSLDPARKRRKGAAAGPPLKTCEQCFAIVHAATRLCPECGFVFQPPREVPEETHGDLQEVSPGGLREKRAAWKKLCAVAATRGFKPGWAHHRYREKFGASPPASFALGANRPRQGTEVSQALRAAVHGQGGQLSWEALGRLGGEP
jgi:DNA repair protein RadD